MNIIKNIININKFTRPGRKLKSTKGLVVHWIGVAQSRASVIRNNYEKESKNYASTQYIIDYNTGDIINAIPENEVAFHVGAKANKYTAFWKSTGLDNPNNYLVGIECCINDNDKITSDYADKNKYLDLGKPSAIQYENLVEFCADFLKRHNLTINNLHRHYDITGKACHVWFYKHEDEWQKFKQKVKEKMEGKGDEEDMTRYNSINEIPDYAKNTINKLIEKKLLNGTENGLNLTEDMIRMLVINDRANLYD